MGSLKKLSQIGTRTLARARALKKIEPVAGDLPKEILHQTVAEWANEMMKIVGVEVKGNTPDLTTPAIYVGNHISYLDIPILFTKAPVVFVAKKELLSWPIIGNGMRRVRTVTVERDSKDSRANISAAIVPMIKEKHQSVAIFPSGTTTQFEEKPWRWGAFRIAYENQIPVIPFRLTYRPLRASAYLLEDTFFPHLLKLLKHEKIEATVEFHPPVQITHIESDTKKWWHWSKPGDGG